ncbi:isocitrate lyase/PEP mutase family protein [Amycolatopsis nigrescens]|uniref:isocitrate lyase/PEP mutase family protein n=1 Tax=Amycolatopsis nigrescens TaxID=381445 RepID=UPI0003819F5D|nr:isocitrate lyase/phosphoenolpyruvate mutase family protein [Amycolatopsis nigrescens]
MTSTHHDRALRFRALHRKGDPLVLPNAWDVAGARIAEAAGASAIATTSAGVAWSLGARDGGGLGRDRALEVVAGICAATGIPVTADLESGYAASPGEVGDTTTRVLECGVVGVNLEDADRSGAAPLRPAGEQGERFSAARQAADRAGIPLYINARIDTYLVAGGAGDQAALLADTIDRAAGYLEAGADGIFVPGVVDPPTVSALAEAVAAPLNIMAGPGAPSVAELAALGVARISIGSAIAQAAYALFRRATKELLDDGSYRTLAEPLDYGELNALFRG